MKHNIVFQIIHKYMLSPLIDPKKIIGLHFLSRATTCLALSIISLSSMSADVHMANGIKIGEVNSDSAIIWTRLTDHPERNVKGLLFGGDSSDFTAKAVQAQPHYDDLSIMQGSVEGTDGDIQVTYWPKSDKAAAKSTQWVTVDPENDYIHQFHLEDLKANTAYQLYIKGRDTDNSYQMAGAFRTAPAPDQAESIQFVVTTCGDYPRRDDLANGHVIYNSMLELDPDFFVHTGDIEYYDRASPFAINLELARFKWNRLYAMPFLRTFHNQVSSYFIKDDHDTTTNDAWPGKNYYDLTWEQGLATFREQVPMGEKTYRTIRWGKDLQIWLVEGRDFRSANNLPDGPQKTIWGETQKQWFFDTVEASDATFKVLLSPTPIVGPDRKGKKDNHANAAFKTEGDQIRQFIAQQDNMYIICGDRHWQYASIDPPTGVREFSCGPASDIHAGGYHERFQNEMHRFLRVKGGFLSVAVDSKSEQITFRHHEVDGTVCYEESFNK